MGDYLKKLFNYLDDPVESQKDALKALCPEEKDALMMCILKSECFQTHRNFDYCLKDGISPDCKMFRTSFFRCSQSLTGMGGALKKQMGDDSVM